MKNFEIRKNFVEVADGFYVVREYVSAFEKIGLVDMDSVFVFAGGDNLHKKSLKKYRARVRFETDEPTKVLFLKRFDCPPMFLQIQNWIERGGRISAAGCEFEPAVMLRRQGIDCPVPIAFGESFGRVFEKRSFVVCESVAGEGLERSLPAFVKEPSGEGALKRKRKFIFDLADFVRRFHGSGARHRDFYFSHIFYDEAENRFSVIDLQRVFRPKFLKRRYTVKDIAQLFYSASGKYFLRTDRLRFYLRYAGKAKLEAGDKKFIRKVLKKAAVMACHNKKHNRPVPFLEERR